MSSYQLQPVAGTTRSTLLKAGIAGGVITAAAGAFSQVLWFTSDVPDDLWRFPWSAGAYPAVNTLWAVAHVLVIAGLLGLGRSRGLLIAVAGSALLTVAELASIPVAESTDPGAVMALFFGGALMSAIGLLMAGRATRLAGLWAVAYIGFAMTPLIYTGIGLWGVLLAIAFAGERRGAGQPSG